MKLRKISAIGVLLFTIPLLVSVKVHAGDINGNEQSVLSVVQGTFEYDGVTYKAAPGYVAKASAHLSDDGVDLTEAQASQAISEIYANVKTGIEEGYIIPAETVTEGSAKPSDSPSEEEGKTDKTQDKKPETKPEKKKEKEPEKKPMIISNTSGTIEAIDKDGNTLFVAESVVKDTGYQFISAFAAIGIIILGLGICFIFILKKQLLAHGHES